MAGEMKCHVLRLGCKNTVASILGFPFLALRLFTLGEQLPCHGGALWRSPHSEEIEAAPANGQKGFGAFIPSAPTNNYLRE